MTQTRHPTPCPFCGSRDLDVQELDVKSWALSCPACGAIGPLHQGQDPLTALQRWNTRPRAGWAAAAEAELQAAMAVPA